MLKKLNIWDNLANIYTFWNKYTKTIAGCSSKSGKMYATVILKKYIYIEIHNDNTFLTHFCENTNTTLWTPLQLFLWLRFSMNILIHKYPTLWAPLNQNINKYKMQYRMFKSMANAICIEC